VQVVHAGVAEDEGQKVHKLRAALRALRSEDRFLIFSDVDIVPPVRMAGRLLFPLVRGKADIVTGYRLLLPENGGMAALVGAVEMQLATLPRSASATMPWGGAMAMTRDVADRLDLDAVLAGRLSDDMAIGQAGWRAGMRLRPVRDLLVATPIGGGVGDLLGFGVRQYRHIATNSMAMWAVAVGYGMAWGRALVRARIIGAVLEEGQRRAAWRSLLWDAVAPFAVTWAHLVVQVVALVSRRIRWGGWDYWVRRGKVERMGRVG
jgi:hypothetical protein